MYKTRNIHHRLLAGVLSLVLMCGMLLSTQFLPAVVAEEAEATQFVANFGTMTDPATQAADLKELFTFYYSVEKKFAADLSNPLAPSGDYITDNRSVQLSFDGKWLKQTVSRTDNQTFRNGFSMAPKGNDFVKNFKAVFDVSLGNLEKAAVTLSFRSDSNGRVNQEASRAVYQNHDMLVLNKAGYQLVNAGKAGGTDDVYDMPTYTAWDGNATVSTATVTVKVVGQNVSLKVEDGANVYCDVNNLTLEKDRMAGYLYFALMNSNIALGNIKITNLDESGDPLNWDGSVPVAKPDYVNRFKADFRTVSESAGLKDLFAFYYSVEKKFAADLSNPLAPSGDYITDGRSVQLSLDGKWLKQTVSRTDNETFRNGFGMAPNGNDSIKNFKAVFDVSLSDLEKSAVVLSFRSDSKGKINQTESRAVYQNQDMLVLNKAGYQLVSAGKAGGTNGVYTLPTYTAWNGNATVSTATVTVEVVGLSVSLKVVGDDDTVYCDTQSLSLLSDRAAGYLYFTLMNHNMAIGDITITNLGQSGNELNWDGTEPEIPTEEQEDNTAVVDGNTITVKAGEGYELKAGSLVVTDANNNVFVPTRVGYREGGDATQYTIPEAAVASFEVDCEFIQPCDETGYNVGFLGTSVNEDKDGLRFVNRFNIDENGEMLYNGEKVAVKEYGMLIASAAILPNAADLDIETAADSMHVHKITWPASGKYFDKCTEYADVSVQIVNIPDGAAKDLDFHTRAYIVLVDDTVVYMDTMTANYNNG